MSIYERLFKDKDGNTVIWQYPNWPIMAAAAAYALDLLHPDDLSIFGEIFLAYWAISEILLGVNLFRRLLGLAVLAVLGIQFI